MAKRIHKLKISPRRQIKEFFLTVAIQAFAISAISIFEPIYLYQKGLGIRGILAYFLVVYALYILLLPFGGKFAKRYGYEHSIFFATFFTIAYYLSLAAIPLSMVFLFAAPFLMVLAKLFWWPACHANFARFAQQGELGRELGFMQIVGTIAQTAGPLIGGLVLLYGNFTFLFAIAIFLLLISALPMFTTPEHFNPSRLGWLETMRFVLGKKNRRRMLGALGFGEEVLAFTIWPLFIFLTLKSSIKVGLVAAAATAATIFSSQLVGYLIDRHKKSEKIYRWATLGQVFSWLLRPWIGNFAGILGVDIVARSSKTAQLIPVYSAVYKDAQKNHVMIRVVAMEAALALGKFLALAVALLVFQFTGSLVSLFLVGLAFSIFYFFFK